MQSKSLAAVSLRREVARQKLADSRQRNALRSAAIASRANTQTVQPHDEDQRDR